jgi:ABC-type antimicrobial peptide transport system permease subunit
MVVIPLRTYEQIYETGGRYLAADIKAENMEDVSKITRKLDEDFEEFNYQTSEMIMKEINGILGTINAVLGGIAGISLLVAGIGIINTMTVSVLERFREIGTMKAIGASSLDILFMFLAESIVTGLLGGTAGAALGFGLSKVMGGFIGLATEPTLDLTLMVVGFAVVTCMVAGAYPAWRASNLHPVEALRHE